MIKIGYYYDGDRDYIKELLNYDLTFIIRDDSKVDELLKYKRPIVKEKYDWRYYDFAISESDDIEASANKKIVLGCRNSNKPRTIYLDKLDVAVLNKPKKVNNIKFTIVVPNYNNADWINRTIESVINQTYKNWEMFIIDDMSSDNSIEVIKSYKDKRITLIENKIKLYNGGSRNIGILKAKETNKDGYLVFIDSDDWLASDNVLEKLNEFIDGEDLITLDYKYFMGSSYKGLGKCNTYKDKYELFMTIGCCCAVWCKCFKVSIAPLFEFNTLMEDRNYHYRLVNKAKNIANLDMVTHIWNKCNNKSVTSDKKQTYGNDIQAKIEWNHCAYRHIAGMLDLLNELEDNRLRSFIEDKIKDCKNQVNNNVFVQW